MDRETTEMHNHTGCTYNSLFDLVKHIYLTVFQFELTPVCVREEAPILAQKALPLIAPSLQTNNTLSNLISFSKARTNKIK